MLMFAEQCEVLCVFGFILISFELFSVVWFVFFKIFVGLAVVVWMSDFALVK